LEFSPVPLSQTFQHSHANDQLPPTKMNLSLITLLTSTILTLHALISPSAITNPGESRSGARSTAVSARSPFFLSGYPLLSHSKAQTCPSALSSGRRTPAGTERGGLCRGAKLFSQGNRIPLPFLHGAYQAPLLYMRWRDGADGGKF
jgi:hypothetical protein